MTGPWYAVLGASSELASHTVRHLAATPGRRFFLHFRTLSGDLKDLLDELGTAAITCQADLSDPADIDRLKQTMLRICPQPAAVLLAATPELRVRRMKEITPDEWLQQLSVQALAPALVLPPLLQAMAKGPAASQVVFVLSDVVRNPPKGMADYVTGKFAAMGLMRALQAEFSNPYLRIHAVAPGMMETRFLRALPELAVDAARRLSPDGKLLDVEDCAERVARLLDAPESLKEDPIYLG